MISLLFLLFGLLIARHSLVWMVESTLPGRDRRLHVEVCDVGSLFFVQQIRIIWLMGRRTPILAPLEIKPARADVCLFREYSVGPVVIHTRLIAVGNA